MPNSIGMGHWTASNISKVQQQKPPLKARDWCHRQQHSWALCLLPVSHPACSLAATPVDTNTPAPTIMPAHGHAGHTGIARVRGQLSRSLNWPGHGHMSGMWLLGRCTSGHAVVRCSGVMQQAGRNGAVAWEAPAMVPMDLLRPSLVDQRQASKDTQEEGA